MDFTEKEIEYIDNLIKYLARSRPPEDAVGEEMLALYPCYVFLHNLKSHIVKDLHQKLQKQQAEVAAVKQQAPSNPTEPVKNGKVETKPRSKKQSTKGK